jgi:hypothetical protein
MSYKLHKHTMFHVLQSKTVVFHLHHFGIASCQNFSSRTFLSPSENFLFCYPQMAKSILSIRNHRALKSCLKLHTSKINSMWDSNLIGSLNLKILFLYRRVLLDIYMEYTMMSLISKYPFYTFACYFDIQAMPLNFI